MEKALILRIVKYMMLFVTIIILTAIAIGIWRMTIWADEVREEKIFNLGKLKNFVEDHQFCEDGSRIISPISLNCSIEDCGKIRHCFGICGDRDSSIYRCWQVTIHNNTAAHLDLGTGIRKVSMGNCFGNIDENFISSQKDPLDNCSFIFVFLLSIIFGVLLLFLLFMGNVILWGSSGDRIAAPGCGSEASPLPSPFTPDKILEMANNSFLK